LSPPSPLPPGAKEISMQLNDIWEDVLQDDDMDANSACNLNSPQLVQDSLNSNQPTPFSLELPPSYDNSPMIEITELMVDTSDPTSTPKKSELDILTPMPSPLNKHSKCQNEFCPYHNNVKISAVSSPSVYSFNSPDTSHSIKPPKTTKKRPNNKNEWSDVKRKRLLNLGQKYITKKGIAKDEKTLGLPCKCRYQCSNKITHEHRVKCFSHFWGLGDRTKQWNFVIKYTEKIKKKRCLNQDVPNNRKFTYKYYLPLITNSNEFLCEKVLVCQTMFLNTLAASSRIFKTAWKKFDGSAIVEQDQRGRHANHRTIITDNMKQSVCDHVRAFAPVESHYVRKNNTKLYLNGDLSIAKMHKLYLEWHDAEKYTCKASLR
jgi:hypothetical protein